jgi:hypothetical protein
VHFVFGAETLNQGRGDWKKGLARQGVSRPALGPLIVNRPEVIRSGGYFVEYEVAG